MPFPARAAPAAGGGTTTPVVPRAARHTAQPAGNCSEPATTRASPRVVGDYTSQHAPRVPGPANPRVPSAGPYPPPVPRRRPLPVGLPRPVTDVYGEALGVLQVAEDLVGREGDALVQAAVTAAAPAPLRHFERDPLPPSPRPHRHANVCA